MTMIQVVDSAEHALLDRLEGDVDATLDRIVESIAGTTAFDPIRDAALPDELRRLARKHVMTYIRSARLHQEVKPDELEFVRERSAQRAREMVPLAATIHGQLVAQRTMIEAIARAAGNDSRSLAAALRLVACVPDYTAAVVSVLVESYIQTVEGERADREADRRNLLEKLLTARGTDHAALGRRAESLGLELGRPQVVVIARVAKANGHSSLTRRWTAETLARRSGRGASRAFVVVRASDVVSVLDSAGRRQARVVLDEVMRAAHVSHGARLCAGIGTPFTDIGGLPVSFDEARRALRHASWQRPIVCSPDEITLFDDLAVSSGPASARLIPARVRLALQEEMLRATLHAYVEANLNATATAKVLMLHPNSVRYRLQRIVALTGRDPRQAADLFELRAAARIIDAETEHAGHLPTQVTLRCASAMPTSVAVGESGHFSSAVDTSPDGSATRERLADCQDLPGRLAPDDVTGTLAFLASDDSAHRF